jgi:hypothetical protein
MKKTSMAERGWALTRMCPCCGKLIVMLRGTDTTTGEKRYVACYALRWDGNPYYVGGVHRKHPGKPYSAYFFRRDPNDDPFFSLD